MNNQPATTFYRENETNWEQLPLPEDSDCSICNRIAIWKSRGDGEASILVPCFRCACSSNFRWFGEYSTNGVTDNDSVPGDHGSFELTNKELLMTLIENQYNLSKERGLIVPSDTRFDCIDIILQNMKQTIDDTERADLQFTLNQIKVWWNSIGSLPTVQIGDTEHEIRFFKREIEFLQGPIQPFLPPYLNERIAPYEPIIHSNDLLNDNLGLSSAELASLPPFDLEEELSTVDDGELWFPAAVINSSAPPERSIITVNDESEGEFTHQELPRAEAESESDQDNSISQGGLDSIYIFSMQYYEGLMNDSHNMDQENTKSLCREGTNILDDVMEKEGNMNEEQYRQLMNIFKQIYAP